MLNGAIDWNIISLIAWIASDVLKIDVRFSVLILEPLTEGLGMSW